MIGSKLEVIPATSDDVAIVLGILEDAARWLLDRGIDQWHPGQWRRKRLLEAIERGETFIARRDGKVVATITLQWEDELFWGDRSADAGYVHRLAVRSESHRAGIGRQLLDWAERTAAAQGRSFLRLDCACENRQLRAYYEALGFTGRGEKTISGSWGTYCAALYERELASL